MPYLNNRRSADAAGTLLLAIGFGVFIFCFQVFLFKSTFVSAEVTGPNLCRWDAGMYKSIVEEGYTYTHPQYNNTGYFILYSLVWRFFKWFGLSVVRMCMVNYLLFSIGFTLLTRIYRLSTSAKLLWLSAPALYIMYIPYSEALFFLLMSVTFYGIYTGRRWLIWSGLLLASLTRATAVFLLPAMLVMELLSGQRIDWYKSTLRYVVNYAIPILTGLAVFVGYQYYKVGVWFIYFIMQRQYQGHTFTKPVFPLSSMEGSRNIWFAALAVLVCVVAIAAVARRSLAWLMHGAKEPDKLFVLSCMYLGIMLYKTVFYNPSWGTGTTLLIGIHRYVFATPFFYVFLYNFSDSHIPYRITDFIKALVLCNLVWLMCGSYVHIIYLLFFNFATIIVFLYMLVADKRLQWPGMMIMGMNICFQVLMFQQFLQGLYLD